MRSQSVIEGRRQLHTRIDDRGERSAPNKKNKPNALDDAREAFETKERILEIEETPNLKREMISQRIGHKEQLVPQQMQTMQLLPRVG
jgi:bacterioferritin (cytochrome b1)